MLNGIDHIVIVTPDLETAIANYTKLGFTVIPGGRHPTGTHNALIAFADGAYIELAAFYEPHPENRWWTFLQRGGGLVDYCMVTDDLKADAAALSVAGVAMSDHYPLSRVRPDGYKLDWILAIPTATQGFTPFLIEDITPRSERVPGQTTHANGVTGIARLTIALNDLTVAEAFGKVAGSAGTPVTRNDLGAKGTRYASGKHTFDFVTPSGSAPISEWLAKHGSSVYEAALTSTGQHGAVDPALALNAHLVLE